MGMVRSGQYKYIAFGRHSYDSSYTPQLFDLDMDPEELIDIAPSNPELVAELDEYLRSIVGDYVSVYNHRLLLVFSLSCRHKQQYALDKLVIANDVSLYKHFFVDKYDN